MSITLRYPYKWVDRKVLLHEGVLFVPDRLEYDEPVEISLESIFCNQAPIHVEYCSGNGSWIISKALEFPEVNWIAIEKKFDRVAKIWSKVRRNQLKNVLIICGEGLNVTNRYIKENSISKVFVNFPDPWPKKRHWKHRIINQSFLSEIYRIMNRSGHLTFVTDDTEYSQVMLDELVSSQKFSPLVAFPFYVTELSGYGSSFFETLWRSKGKNIYYHQWKRVQ